MTTATTLDNRPNWGISDVFTSTMSRRSSDFYPYELLACVEEQLDRVISHQEWLVDHTGEPDRDAQLNECKERIPRLELMIDSLGFMFPRSETQGVKDVQSDR